MNTSYTVRRFFILAAITVLSAGCYAEPLLPEPSRKNLEANVQLFAKSYYLGTGASHFVTSVSPVDTENAVAVIGEAGDLGRDSNAYTVYLKLIQQKWRVVRIEFVYRPTGKKTSQEVLPPFPYPGWRKDAP
ncbi:hypothetical protein [Polaromonas aquatica]|uniref:hypothetical protein n=1 Tax=Polaromonas aquatica TaxID=332657 RepID=UPI003D65C158